MFFESIEAFQTAITIYSKLNMKIHHIFACGDYFLSKIHIASKQSSEVDFSDSLLFKDSDMIPVLDFGSELNAYPLLTSSIYAMLDGQKIEDVADQITKAKGLFEKSLRLDPELKDQLIQMLDTALQSSNDNSEELFNQIHSIRNTLVDFIINLSEAALYESNKPQSSTGSSFSDELGSLIEIVTNQPELTDCLLKMAHIIRVLLKLPQ